MRRAVSMGGREDRPASATFARKAVTPSRSSCGLLASINRSRVGRWCRTRLLVTAGATPLPPPSSVSLRLLPPSRDGHVRRAVGRVADHDQITADRSHCGRSEADIERAAR